MLTKTREVFDELLALPATERALFADELLASLHVPDSQVERAWVEEVKDRLAAFDRGEIQELTEEEFFAEHVEP